MRLLPILRISDSFGRLVLSSANDKSRVVNVLEIVFNAYGNFAYETGLLKASSLVLYYIDIDKI